MGVISRLYTFVNGNKAMAQQVNAEFDQLVNAHNSNEGVIADIQTQISTGLATKAELADVTLGLIPDDTITQQKLAPTLRDALPAQYVRNRVPTSADNYAAGHKIGDAWYIPDITLNNFIPTPLAVSPSDFIIQNANSAASGSAITLTCQSGFEYAILRRTITPVAGALYCLFATVKLTSNNTLTSIALNDQVIPTPVKDTTYNIACVVNEPTQFEVKVLAADGAALNGATVVIDKLTIVNMTADMDGVPFDKAGAEAYFQVNPAFLTHKFNNAKTRWYCSDNGVWQSSSQLSDETKALWGVENVDDALKMAIPLSSYMAFCTNANTLSLDAGFGKNNIERILGLGDQLIMYARFKGDDEATYPLTSLKSKDTLLECVGDVIVLSEMLSCPSIALLMDSSPFAKTQMTSEYVAKALAYLVGIDPGSVTNMSDIVSSKTIMDQITTDTKSMYALANSERAMDSVISSSIARNSLYDNYLVTQPILSGSHIAKRQMAGSTQTATGSRAYGWGTLYSGKAFVLTMKCSHLGPANWFQCGNFLIAPARINAPLPYSTAEAEVNKFASYVEAYASDSSISTTVKYFKI